MNVSKQKKAAFLLDEIGNVNDVYVQEALQYRNTAPATRRILTAIACSLLVAVIGLGVAGQLDAFFPDPEIPNENPSTYVSLDEFLCTERETFNCITLSVSGVNYFENAHLILQYEGDDTLYQSRALTDKEVGMLRSMIGNGSAVGSDSPTLACRVWLIMGDGSVISPYLSLTPGNVGSAVLFDYEAELLPSENMISYISDILNS